MEIVFVSKFVIDDYAPNQKSHIHPTPGSAICARLDGRIPCRYNIGGMVTLDGLSRKHMTVLSVTDADDWMYMRVLTRLYKYLQHFGTPDLVYVPPGRGVPPTNFIGQCCLMIPDVPEQLVLAIYDNIIGRVVPEIRVEPPTPPPPELNDAPSIMPRTIAPPSTPIGSPQASPADIQVVMGQLRVLQHRCDSLKKQLGERDDENARLTVENQKQSRKWEQFKSDTRRVGLRNMMKEEDLSGNTPEEPLTRLESLMTMPSTGSLDIADVPGIKRVRSGSSI
jgi:hypothetical protein